MNKDIKKRIDALIEETEMMRKCADANGCENIPDDVPNFGARWKKPPDMIQKKVNEYPQAQEENEFRYLSPAWLDEIARGLTAGAQKYPNETWRQIPPKEHAWRAVRHLILYLKGDNGDTHLVNASMRCMMAFETAAAENVRETWEKRMKEKGCG